MSCEYPAEAGLIVSTDTPAAFTVGAELATMGVLTTVLMELHGYSAAGSKVGLALYLAGIAGGRLFFGFVVKDEHVRAFIAGLIVASTAAFVALVGVAAGDFLLPVVTVAGFAISAIVPLIFAEAGIGYPKDAGTVLGLLKTAIPLGGAVVPFLIAQVSRHVSFAASLWLIPGALVVALGVMPFVRPERRG